VEVSLLIPWVYFLFAGAFDMGFYAHSLIAATNAARAAALYTSSGFGSAADAAGACQFARQELYGMANARTLTNCDSLPLRVTAQTVVGVDGAQASRVTVVYQTPRLIPLPRLPGQLTVTRVAEMRIKEL
jgi:hypothetical protein